MASIVDLLISGCPHVLAHLMCYLASVDAWPQLLPELIRVFCLACVVITVYFVWFKIFSCYKRKIFVENTY